MVYPYTSTACTCFMHGTFSGEISQLPYLFGYKTSFSLFGMTTNNEISAMKFSFNMCVTLPK